MEIVGTAKKKIRMKTNIGAAVGASVSGCFGIIITHPHQDGANSNIRVRIPVISDAFCNFVFNLELSFVALESSTTPAMPQETALV